jgi:hypothetical protein
MIAVAGALLLALPWLVRPRHGKYRGVTHSLVGLAAVVVTGVCLRPLRRCQRFGAIRGGWLR